MGSAIEKDGISIHALREESDQTADAVTLNLSKFQSTLSVRRATSTTVFSVIGVIDFNPRSP